LKDLLERRQVYGHAVPRKPIGSLRSEPVQYIPCPECEALMTRRNFGSNSGVIVDVCAMHGIWFDVGELPRVIAFVESGGLARSELRNPQVASARHRPNVAPLPLRSNALPSVRETDLLDDLAEAANALLGFVSGSLRR
jgi:Zn-finger nucleic acid-binding protein